jgi:hypothetical protein
MHVKALEYMVQSNTLPCNVKFMIEGEEEIGSKVCWFVERNQENLKRCHFNFRYRNDFESATVYHHWFTWIKLRRSRSYRSKPRLAFGLYGGAVANPINVLAK